MKDHKRCEEGGSGMSEGVRVCSPYLGARRGGVHAVRKRWGAGVREALYETNDFVRAWQAE